MALNVGEVTATADIDSTKFNKGIGNMGDRVGKFKKTAKLAFAGVATAIAGVGAAGAIMVGAVSDAADYAYEIQKASEATGVSVQNVQELRYAFEKVGLEPDETSEVLMEMNRTMGEAITKGGDMKKRYEALGISMDNLKDMSAAEGFMKVVKGLSQMEDRGRATLIAGKLFGEDIQKNLGHLIYGWDKLKNLRGEFEDSDMGLSEEEIDSAAAYNQTIEELKQKTKGLWRQFGKIALPYLKDFADVLIKNLPKIFGALEDFHAWIDKAGKLKGLFESLENVLGKETVENLKKIGGALGDFFKTLGKVLGPTLKKMLPVIGNFLQMLVDLLSLDFSGAGEEYVQYVESVVDMWGTLFEEIMEHTKLDEFMDMWKRGLNAFGKAINNLPGINVELAYPDFAEAQKKARLKARTGTPVGWGAWTGQTRGLGDRVMSAIGYGVLNKSRRKSYISELSNIASILKEEHPAQRLFPAGKMSGASLLQYLFTDLEGQIGDATPKDQHIDIKLLEGATINESMLPEINRLARMVKEWKKELNDDRRGGGLK